MSAQKGKDLVHMSRNNFDACLARVLAHEGGYSNHPADPGGPTNFGITLGDYRKFVKADATAANVRAMRVDEARAIYRAQYWNALRCDELPAGVDYALFDYGVNSGVARAIRVLRRLLGLPDASNLSDPVVAAAALCDRRRLIAAICDERLAFLRSLKTWPVFGAGWGRRVAEVRAAALKMVAASFASSSTVRDADAKKPSSSPGKGVVPANKIARGTIAGAIAALGAAVARIVSDAGIGPFAVVAIIAAAFALSVAAWLLLHRRHQQKQNAPMLTGEKTWTRSG